MSVLTFTMLSLSLYKSVPSLDHLFHYSFLLFIIENVFANSFPLNKKLCWWATVYKCEISVIFCALASKKAYAFSWYHCKNKNRSSIHIWKIHSFLSLFFKDSFSILLSVNEYYEIISTIISILNMGTSKDNGWICYLKSHT